MILENAPLAEQPLLPKSDTPKWKSALALIILSSYILLAVFKSTGKAPGAMLPPNARDFLVFSTRELLLFGLFWLCAVTIGHLNRQDLLWRWREGWKPLWQGLLYSVALRLAPMVILFWVLILAMLLGMNPEQIKATVTRYGPSGSAIVDASALADPFYKLLLLTWGSFIVAALREELWRVAMLTLGTRLLQPAVSQRNAAIGALIFSSLLFGIGHLYQGWLAVGLTTLIGALLGAIMLKHRSIWPAVIAHGAFDATTFLMLGWAKEFAKP